MYGTSVTRAPLFTTSVMQAMMWGEHDLAGIAVVLGNDAEFGINTNDV